MVNIFVLQNEWFWSDFFVVCPDVGYSLFWDFGFAPSWASGFKNLEGCLPQRENRGGWFAHLQVFEAFESLVLTLVIQVEIFLAHFISNWSLKCMQVSVHNIRLPKQSTVGDVVNELKGKVFLIFSLHDFLMLLFGECVCIHQQHLIHLIEFFLVALFLM